MNPMLNPRAAGPEGSLIGIPGTNQGGNNLTLNGWPLTGFDQIFPGLLQQQKSYIHKLTPQQQQLMLAQQNLTSPSSSDLESRRLRMLMNNPNMGLGKDGISNSVGDVSNVASPMQAGYCGLPRGDPDMQFKLKMAQLQPQQQNNNHQTQQQLQQRAFSSQQSQSSNHNLHQQENIGSAGNGTVDGSLSNSFQTNDQAGRKREQPLRSSDHDNSSETTNTAGPTPNSAPSLPSTHTPGDVISMSALLHSGTSSKPLIMFCTGRTGNLASSSNHLADMDRFVDDGSLDDNVESFLSHDDTDPRDIVGRCMDVSKGFPLMEVSSIRASSSKVICCHFSSDGKLLASGGHDKKISSLRMYGVGSSRNGQILRDLRTLHEFNGHVLYRVWEITWLLCV